MKKRLSLVEVLLKVREWKMICMIFSVMAVIIIGAIVLSNNIETTSKLFSSIETVIEVSAIVLFAGSVSWCLDIKLRNRRLIYINRMGLSEKEKYASTFFANTMTFAISYIALALAISFAYCQMVSIKYGKDIMIQVMVMHNNSLLFGELLPIYQPLLIIRNIILILSLGQLTASAVLKREHRIIPINEAIGLFLAAVLFASREFIYDPNTERVMLFVIFIIVISCSIFNTFRMLKEENKEENKEGNAAQIC